MTEHGTWTEEYYLASDLWATEKSMAPMMLEPLILALADALGRAREEERRAEDRISRPEGAELAPREEERLRSMLRRSDALNNALTAVVAEEDVREEIRAECVGVLEEAGREAHEAFERYREEVGIPGPLDKPARKPA